MIKRDGIWIGNGATCPTTEALAGGIFHTELRQDLKSLRSIFSNLSGFCLFPNFRNTSIYSCWSASAGSEGSRNEPQAVPSCPYPLFQMISPVGSILSFAHQYTRATFGRYGRRFVFAILMINLQPGRSKRRHSSQTRFRNSCAVSMFSALNNSPHKLLTPG